MKIREIMTAEVATAAPDTTLEEIATIMKRDDIGSVPIVEDDELCGIVTDRDIVIRCIAEGLHPGDTRAEDILTEDLHTVETDDDVENAAELMASHQIRRLPVVEEGRLVGMIAIGDIAVKQGDDRRSGDTLEDISQGVKQERGTRRKQPSAGIRAAKKHGTASAPEARAGDSAQQGLRDKRSSGARGRSSAKSAATRGRSIDSRKQGITNRSAGEETARNTRVVPIRESRSSDRKPSTRKKAG